MFGRHNKGLKQLDFYRAVPNQLQEGTKSGVCLSVISITVLIIFTISSFLNFLEPKIIKDLIFDQKNLAQKLRVNIQIQFPKYPCSFLSFDVENELKVRIVNYEDRIQKFVLPSGQLYSDKNLTDQQKMKRIQSDVEKKNGCRFVGWFEIDRVSGNFHFSGHGYGNLIPQLFSRIPQFDMSHKIKILTFGDPKNTVIGGNTLSGFNSQKQIDETFLGISYIYFMNIIEHNVISQNSDQGNQSYIYNARFNQVSLAQLPQVLFKYETSSMAVLQIIQQKQWHLFLINFVGILGGIFTVSVIIDRIMHSSIRLMKHQFTQKQKRINPVIIQQSDRNVDISLNGKTNLTNSQKIIFVQQANQIQLSEFYKM